MTDTELHPDEFDLYGVDPAPEVRPSILDRIVTGDELDAMTFPPLRWAVPGVIPEGFGLLVGPPKLGKSWLALGLGLAIASGGHALGAIDTGQPRPVLYLALEDGHRRLQARCHHLDPGAPIPARLHVVTQATPAEIFDLIETWLQVNPAGVVLLDTLGKVMPPALPGESAYARDYRVGGRLKDLTDTHPGASLVVVHHNRKAGAEDWMDNTSGTQGLNGAADFTIGLTRSRNSDAAMLRVTGRDVPEGEYALTLTEGTWRLDGDGLEAAAQLAREQAATEGLGDDSARIVALTNRSPEGIRAGDVAEALEMSAKDAGTYLLRLEKAGRITRLARGLYGTPIPPVGSVGSVGTEGHVPTQPTLPTPLQGEEAAQPGTCPKCLGDVPCMDHWKEQR